MDDATTLQLCVHCQRYPAKPGNRRLLCERHRNNAAVRKRYPVVMPRPAAKVEFATKEPETMADVEALIAERLALVMNDTTGKYAWWWHHTRACAVGATKRRTPVVRVRWWRDTLVAEVV